MVFDCRKGDARGLAASWVRARIKDLCNLVNGRAFKPAEWAEQGLPIIRIQNLNDPDADFNHCDFNVPSKYYVKHGDLLFAWSGTPGTSFGAHVWRGGIAVLNQHIFRVEIPEKYLCKSFLMYALNHNVNEYIRKAHGGSGLAHITKRAFEASSLPLPPLPEQHRIVSKIEELFTRLDAGVEALEKVKALLNRYRQSVLKAAFEGKLTQAWREEQLKDPDSPLCREPASVLLERIRAEREKQSKGKRKKKKQPEPIDTSALPELPEGWEWARLSDIAAITGGVTKNKARDTTGCREVPYLRVANVQRGYLDLTVVKTIAVNEDVIDELRLRRGDILFTEGGDRDKLGRGWVWDCDIPECIHQNHVFRARLYCPNILPKFVSIYSNTHGQLYFMQEGTQTTNLASINLTKLSAFPVAIPPEAEQRQIVSDAEQHLSIVDAVEQTINQSLQHSNRLRQSILKRAFEGKLVPQDPNDEPAEKLLERIKAEKAKADSKGNQKAKRRRSRS